MCNEYNGWANYPTWNVALWIDNNEGEQLAVIEQAGECFRDADNPTAGSQLDAAVYAMAEWLKDYFEDNRPATVGVYADILGWALAVVDWYELARSYVEQWLDGVEYERGSND